jgi:uncharacterized repeat protein (TIGR03803 family)
MKPIITTPKAKTSNTKFHLWLLLLIPLFGINPLMAQITDLHNFSFNSNPYGDVTASGNKLYGSANQGGKNNFGYFFSVNKDGSGFKDIWDCNDTGSVGNSNGGYPCGDVVIINNKLYGFNEDGGAYGYGNIFSIDTEGNGYKDLHDFNDTTGASMQQGVLTLVGNKFFGMTYGGGAYGYGVIFSMDMNGKGYKDLFDFNGTSGANPQNTLAVYQNKLFGMTYVGGANDSGVIFSIDTDGSGYKDLVDLNYSTGFYPYGYLTIVGDKLFGMTNEGGVHDSGVIFELEINGKGYKRLLDMNSATGCFPQGGLILAGNKLYGITYQGGANNLGAIFSLDTNGYGYERIYDFVDSTSGFAANSNNITVSNDTIFGMVWDGGPNGYGELFGLKDTTLTASINTTGNPTDVTTINNPVGTLNIYPNPNNGVFKLVITDYVLGTMNTIEIYNMLGEKIYTTSLTAANTQIDLSNYAGGMYIYRLLHTTGDLVSTGKIIIQK